MTGYDIIVVPGQSNGVGWGLGSFGVYSGDTSMDQYIDQIGRRSPNDMTIIPAVEPLHHWDYDNNRHGFAIVFARRYAKTHLDQANRRVLIVPAAKGGTSILEWLGLVGAWGSLLYPDLKTRIDMVLDEPGDHQIVAWLESQCESDVLIALDSFHSWHSQMPDAATYQTRKLDLIDTVQVDYPNTKMLFGMPPPSWLPGDATKNAFKTAIQNAATARTGCAWVSSAGLSSNGGSDTIHFSAVGQGALGYSYFNVWKNMP